MKLFIISGARPQFIKLAPIIEEILKRNDISLYHLHTGQHFDKNMSNIFFEELGLPSPDINLGINRGSHAELVGKMLIEIEKELIIQKPEAILVVGDTNSTIAGGLAAVKLQIPVIHLESGLRSNDFRMPEEINRRLTDHLCRLLITTSETATNNLIAEGIKKEWIFQTGDPMVDGILRNINKAEEKSSILKEHGLKSKEYVLLTMHRQENVDIKERIVSILESLKELNITIVYPIHPRTKKRIEEFGIEDFLDDEKWHIIKPVGYLDFIKLQKNAKIILTDSGGIQKEALTLNIPCITLRDNTEWVETLEIGANTLVGAEKAKIIEAVNNILQDENKYTNIRWENPYGDGRASKEIVVEIIRRYIEGELDTPTSYMIE